MKKEIKQRIIIIILVCLLIGALIYIICLSRCSDSQQPTIATNPSVAEDSNAVDYEGVRSPLLPNGEQGIAIPGFDRLVFLSGQNTQTVTFYNPANNNCYFVFSLIVDGDELYKSSYIAPDKCVYEIELSKQLAKGNYDGVLHIDCYDLTDLSALNQADIKITLEVK